LKWQNGISELEFRAKADAIGIVLRPLSMYEQQPMEGRDWYGAVLGFGNIKLADIDSRISELAHLLQT
jgi:GntR family transcriptional regulator/MocR family aminotransferase